MILRRASSVTMEDRIIIQSQVFIVSDAINAMGSTVLIVHDLANRSFGLSLGGSDLVEIHPALQPVVVL